jgi:hypothetical protein
MTTTTIAPLNEPTPELVEEMRRHYEDEHGHDFDLRRDVYFEGNTPPETTFDVRAASAAGPAAFYCKHCPGLVFPVGDVAYGSPQRNAFVQLHDRGLRTLLPGVGMEDRDAVTELYDRRKLFSAVAAEAHKRQGQQTAVESSPEYLKRLERCLSYLIWQLELLGTQPKAIDALVALGKRDPTYYAEITGSTWELRPGTFESYLKQLPPEIKKQAKQAFLDRKAAERDQRRR